MSMYEIVRRLFVSVHLILIKMWKGHKKRCFQAMALQLPMVMKILYKASNHDFKLF